MSFTLINRSFFLILSLLFLFSCSTNTVYEKIKPKTYKTPLVKDIDDKKISIYNNGNKQINFKNELVLKDFKNHNPYFDNIVIKNNNIFAYQKNKLYNFNYNTGDLLSTKELKLSNEEDILISLEFLNNSFILAFKSGKIIRLNTDYETIWKYESNKPLNTQLVLSDNQIVLLYVDEIKSLRIEDGAEIWSEIYQDIPIYQAKGGQLAIFNNIKYFILPNNNIGAIDQIIGKAHYSKLEEIPLISSINNTKDIIHVYENYLVYLDEGKYLYTLDIFNDEFILFKKEINLLASTILFNNSIILKEGNHIQAINSNNGKTFWLISDDKISKESKIISIRSFQSKIELFLSNGDVLLINNKELININNLGVGEINYISFEKQNIIIYAKNKKTYIY
jgi:outer membrane protein assembly factor BamB